MADQHPIASAEELLHLVKFLYPVVKSTSTGDAQEVFVARKRVQRLSAIITLGVLGPLEYTVLLAGALRLMITSVQSNDQ